MTKHNFKHMKVRLNTDQFDNLKLIAFYLGKPVAVLIREMVDGYLFANEIVLNQARMRLVCLNGQTHSVLNLTQPKAQESKEDAIYEKLDRLIKWITEQ